jgi:hypothetical protein
VFGQKEDLIAYGKVECLPVFRQPEMLNGGIAAFD